jgi:hypothetical protein
MSAEKKKLSPQKSTLSLKQIIELYSAIKALGSAGIVVDVGALIDISIFAQKIKPLIDGYNEAMKAPPEYQRYLEERANLQRDLAVKGKDGLPILINGGRQLIYSDPAKAQAELEVLDVKHKAAVDAAKAKENDAEVKLSQQHPIDLISIPRSAFSGESASAADVIAALLPIIGE